MNTAAQQVNKPSENASYVSVPLITKLGFCGGFFILTILILLIINSINILPPIYKPIFQWPWHIYHGIFGVIIGLIFAEFFWIYSQWYYFESGEIPGWAKIAVPTPLEDPEKNIAYLVPILKDIVAKKCNFLIVISTLPFLIAIIFELPYVKKESTLFGEVWGHTIAGAFESIVTLTLSCLLYLNWIKFIDHWKLKASSGSLSEVNKSNELRKDIEKEEEKFKDLQEINKKLEERIFVLENPIDPRGPRSFGIGHPMPYPTPLPLKIPTPNPTDGEIPNGPDDWTPVSLSTKTTENGSDNSNNGVSLNPDERPSF